MTLHVVVGRGMGTLVDSTKNKKNRLPLRRSTYHSLFGDPRWMVQGCVSVPDMTDVLRAGVVDLG